MNIRFINYHRKETHLRWGGEIAENFKYLFNIFNIRIITNKFRSQLAGTEWGAVNHPYAGMSVLHYESPASHQF